MKKIIMHIKIYSTFLIQNLIGMCFEYIIFLDFGKYSRTEYNTIIHL